MAESRIILRWGKQNKYLYNVNKQLFLEITSPKQLQHKPSVFVFLLLPELLGDPEIVVVQLPCYVEHPAPVLPHFPSIPSLLAAASVDDLAIPGVVELENTMLMLLLKSKASSSFTLQQRQWSVDDHQLHQQLAAAPPTPTPTPRPTPTATPTNTTTATATTTSSSSYRLVSWRLADSRRFDHPPRHGARPVCLLEARIPSWSSVENIDILPAIEYMCNN